MFDTYLTTFFSNNWKNNENYSPPYYWEQAHNFLNLTLNGLTFKALSLEEFVDNFQMFFPYFESTMIFDIYQKLNKSTQDLLSRSLTRKFAKNLIDKLPKEVSIGDKNSFIKVYYPSLLRPGANMLTISKKVLIDCDNQKIFDSDEYTIQYVKYKHRLKNEKNNAIERYSFEESIKYSMNYWGNFIDNTPSLYSEKVIFTDLVSVGKMKRLFDLYLLYLDKKKTQLFAICSDSVLERELKRKDSPFIPMIFYLSTYNPKIYPLQALDWRIETFIRNSSVNYPQNRE